MTSMREWLMAAQRRRAGIILGAPASRSATAAGPPRVLAPPYMHQTAGGWHAAPRTNIARRPPATPIHHYRTRHSGPIRNDGTRQGVIVGGTVQVQVGPQGLGTVWELQQAAVTTTTGPNDASLVTLYAGPVSIANMIGGQSYSGGGDTIGLTGLKIQTGEFLIAVWTLGHNGDAATIRLSGIEQWLG